MMDVMNECLISVRQNLDYGKLPGHSGTGFTNQVDRGFGAMYTPSAVRRGDGGQVKSWTT